MANNFFNAAGSPSTGSQAASAAIRSEFASIAAGFDKLPVLTANGNKCVLVNAGGTALTVSNGTLSLEANLAIGAGNGITLTAQGVAANVKVPPVGNLVSHNSTDTLSNKTMNGLTVSGNVLSMNGITCVLAHHNTTVLNVTGNGAVYNIPFDTEIVDYNNDFANNMFTAPSNGIYAIAARVSFGGISSLMDVMQMNLITTARTFFSTHNVASTGTSGSAEASVTLEACPMNAGETARLTVSITGDTNNNADLIGSGPAGAIRTHLTVRKVA